MRAGLQTFYADELVSPRLRGSLHRQYAVKISVKDGEILDIEKISRASLASISKKSIRLKTVIPGLVDCHTHLVFGGDRSAEWNLRLSGMSYQDIAKAGGGIKSTMKATRSLAAQDLFSQARLRMLEALRFGVTTLEVKTGYGLNLESELKLLDVITRLKKSGPQSVLTTFMAAHALPPEFETYHSYAEWIVRALLPRVQGRAEFQDVFCEKGYFSEEDSVYLLEAGKKYGLRPKVHAHEFGRTGGVRAAVRTKAISADHLMHLSRHDISALKRASVVPVLLPGTTFFLREKHYAPARALIDAGVPVALGSDFNPGTCPTLNFPLIGSFAAVHMKMTLDEVLWSQTVGSSMALGLRDRGRLERGMRADFIELDSAGFESLYYHFGSPPISRVVIGGRIV